MHRRKATQSLLAQGDLLRKQGKWYEAATCYERVLQQAPGLSNAILNLALCNFALGRFEQASRHALSLPAADANYWRAYVIHARSQVGLGRIDVAVTALRACLKHNPGSGDVALELADILLHRIGDAAGARACVKPFLEQAQYREAALQTYIVASLYDRDEDTFSLVETIKEFAKGIGATPIRRGPVFAGSGRSRKRVGIISAYFSVSPVYFLTYGVLKELSNHVDLVFFDRGSKKDWAYNRFQAIASDWVDVDLATPSKLSEALHVGDLDVLLEMAGWSDVDVLKAITDKPCAKVYKWVGGQSVTTGLEVFDGFISDKIQTPAETQIFYTEKLINLESGYVSYTPPDYLPPSVPARSDLLLLGVVGNPVKVSRQFLEKVAGQLTAAAQKIEVPIALQFIDSRYASPLVRERISEILKPMLGGSPRIAVLFTQPASHKDFLGHVSRLSAVIDTEPYSAGLTALEALAMGVPILTSGGAICSERHALSHHYYARGGQQAMELSPEHLQFLQRLGGKRRDTGGLLGSRRLRHADVARELLALFNA